MTVIFMEEYRDQMGLIQIDKLDISGEIPIKLFDSYSFLYQNQRYFFKTAKNISQIYNELIAHELANDFGIESIPYDLAYYHDSIGVISKDCMKKGDKLLEDLLMDYFHEDYHEKCNLDDTVLTLMETYGDSCNSIIDELMHMMMFDIIIANHDRHDRNIIINTETRRLGPLVDNEMLLSDQALYDNYYSFKVTSRDDNTIANLIKILNDNQLLFFYKKVEIISPENIEDVFRRVEAKIKTPMVGPIKEELRKKFAFHYRSLLNILKEELVSRKVLAKK